MFYPAAIETALNTGDWDAAERYAAALEDYTRAEPLPLIDSDIARGRALARLGPRSPRCGRGRAPGAPAARRRSALGLRAALPAIEAALAGQTRRRQHDRRPMSPREGLTI